MTSRARGAGRVPGLDAVRTFSALLLVLFHATIFSGPSRLDGNGLQAFATAGYLAVDVFFVLSGVLLFLPAAEKGSIGSLKDYYVRRATRILPMYWLVIALAMVFRVNPPEGRAFLPPSGAGWRELAVHLGFLQTPVYGLDFRRNGLGFDGVVWTLSIEVFFYVLLPLFVRPMLKRPWVFLAAALTVSRVWVWFAEHMLTGERDKQHMIAQLPTYAFHFAVGMGIAMLIVHARDSGRGRELSTYAPGIFAAGSLATISYLIAAGTKPAHASAPQLDAVATSPVLVVGLAVMIVGAVAVRGRIGRALAMGWIFVVSDATYGLFLLHLPLMKAVQDGLARVPQGRPSDFGELIGAAALALVAAVVLSRFYERPLRRAVHARLLVPTRQAARPVTLPAASVRTTPLWVKLLTGTAAVGLLTWLPMLRGAGRSPTQVVWAEDGGIYLTQWLTHGVSSVGTPYNGYLHVLPRLLTWPAAALPLKDAAWVMAVTASLVTALLAIVVWWASGLVIRTRALRAIAAVAVALLPQTTYETQASLTDLHWALLVTLGWVLLAAPISRWGRVLAIALAIATTLSDPLAFTLLPLAWIGARRSPDRYRALVAPVCMVPCLAVQETVHLSTGFMHAGATHLGDVPSIYALRVLVSTVVGDTWLSDFATGAAVLAAAGLLWIIGLGALARRATSWHRLAAGGLLLASVLLTCLPLVLRGTVGFLDHPLSLNGSRYAVPGIQLLLAALLVLLDDTGMRLRAPACLAIAAALVAQNLAVIDLGTTRTYGPDWQQSLKAAAQRCADPERTPDIPPQLGGRHKGDDVAPRVGPDDVVVAIDPDPPGQALLFGVVLRCSRFGDGG